MMTAKHSEIFALVNAQIAYQYRVVVVDKVGDTLLIACENPLDKDKLELLREALGCPMVALLAAKKDLEEKLLTIDIF